MFRIESNQDEFIKNQLSALNDLKSADKILRTAALNTVVIISDRIQQRGEKTDGSKIVTSSPTKTGAYSKEYGKKRQSKGRQTSIIDMTFTDGGMMDDLTVEPSGENEYLVGFSGKQSSDKAEWNEDRFGELFSLSNSEQELVDNIIVNKVNEILR